MSDSLIIISAAVEGSCASRDGPAVRRRRYLRALVAAAAASLGGCTVLSTSETDGGPDDALRAFYEATNAGDLDRARDLLHGDTLVGTNLYPLEEGDRGNVTVRVVEDGLRGDALDERLEEVGRTITGPETETSAGRVRRIVDGETVAELEVEFDRGDPGERVRTRWLLATESGDWKVFAPLLA